MAKKNGRRYLVSQKSRIVALAQNTFTILKYILFYKAKPTFHDTNIYNTYFCNNRQDETDQNHSKTKND